MEKQDQITECVLQLQKKVDKLTNKIYKNEFRENISDFW